MKILDTTLSEGGYLNNWKFSKDFCYDFIKQISYSGIEYIEIGLLKNVKLNNKQNIFNQIEDINELIPSNINTKVSAMLIVEDFDINKIVPKTTNIKLDAIRLSFTKNQQPMAFSYINKIKDCGYELFIFLDLIDNYSDLELIKLLDKINEFMPDCVFIGDSKGVLNKNDIVRIYYLMKNHLNSNCSFGCHIQNNLYRAFGNSKTMIKECLNNKNLIIDSSILGMGRGVGILQTELICDYLNKDYNKTYNLIPILKILDKQIYPYFIKNPWGNPTKYFMEELNNNLNNQTII